MHAVLLLLTLAALSPADSSAGDDVVLAKVPPPSVENSLAPNLASGPGGVYFSWVERVEKGFALKLARWDGATWSAAKTIVQSRRLEVNEADAPALAAFADGSLVAQWMEPSESGRDGITLFVARSPDGGKTWGKPAVLSPSAAPGERGFVSFLEGDEPGSFSAVWLDGSQPKGSDSTDTRLTLSPWKAKGEDGKFGAGTVLDPRVCDCCATAATRTPAGPFIAYRDRTASEGRDISVLSATKGVWSKPAEIHADGWMTPACPVNGPAVAADGANVAVAWFTAANKEPKVNIAFSTDSGRSFAAPIRIDEGRPAGRADVLWLPGGWALVSWVERVQLPKTSTRASAEGAALRACWVTPDGKLGMPITISELSGGSADSYPRMTRKGAEVFFAWTEGTEKPEVRVVRMRGLNVDHPRGFKTADVKGTKTTPKAAASKTLDSIAPDFKGTSLDGIALKLGDFRGKVVLLSFFGTWCPPCRREIPEVVKLRASLTGKAFEVIAVNAGDDKATLKDFVGKQGMKYPVIQDQGHTDLFGVTGFPTNVVIDKKGRVRYRSTGYSPNAMKEMSTLVRQLEAEK